MGGSESQRAEGEAERPKGVENPVGLTAPSATICKNCGVSPQSCKRLGLVIEVLSAVGGLEDYPQSPKGRTGF